MTVQEFKTRFPEFDTSLNTNPYAVEFSDSQIQYWLDVAAMMANPYIWGDQLDLAIGLFTAHNLTLEAMSQQGIKQGKIPGITSMGIVASKASGDVSVSYDTASVLEPGAGHWNYTLYGKRLWHLIQLFGAGPVHVGAGYDPTGGLNGPGWQGPFVLVPNTSE